MPARDSTPPPSSDPGRDDEPSSAPPDGLTDPPEDPEGDAHDDVSAGPSITLAELQAYLRQGATVRRVHALIAIGAPRMPKWDRDDLAQAILMRLWTSEKRPTSLETADSWLFACCENAILTRHRDARRDRDRIDDGADLEHIVDPIASADDDPPPQDLETWLEQREMTQADRDLLTLVTAGARDGLSMKETAERAKLTANALQLRVHRLKERHALARCRHREGRRTLMLWALFGGLGALVLGLIAWWVLWRAPPVRAIDPLPAPEMTAAPRPTFDNALQPPVPSAPSALPPAPKPTALPREDKPTGPR